MATGAFTIGITSNNKKLISIGIAIVSIMALLIILGFVFDLLSLDSKFNKKEKECLEAIIDEIYNYYNVNNDIRNIATEEIWL